MTDRCFYFGCWNKPGHFLRPSPGYEEGQKVCYYLSPGGEECHLDGSLAPRRKKDGSIWWYGAATSERERNLTVSSECPQGQALLHHLSNGFTAVQWWDRCQGDARRACNSTILLEGKHTFDEMMGALLEHFPQVLENLGKHGGEIVEIRPTCECHDWAMVGHPADAYWPDDHPNYHHPDCPKYTPPGAK